MWNIKSRQKNFKDRPLIYSTKPLFSICVNIASFAIFMISFALFQKAGYNIMNLLIFIVVCVLYLIFRQIFRFLKYLSFEKRYKNEIKLYLRDGVLLPEAIAQAFRNLNKDKKIGLSDSTINEISYGLSELVQKMDTENVIDIYASFIYLYVFYNGKDMGATYITDEKLTNYFLGLNLQQKKGYYAIRHIKKNKKDE